MLLKYAKIISGSIIYAPRMHILRRPMWMEVVIQESAILSTRSFKLTLKNLRNARVERHLLKEVPFLARHPQLLLILLSLIRGKASSKIVCDLILDALIRSWKSTSKNLPGAFRWKRNQSLLRD